MSESRRTDAVFKALADPTRRRILDLLTARPRTTGDLAAAFPAVSRFAVMKRLAVLQRAGLLVIHREGRTRMNTLNPVPLKDVLRRWMTKHEELWSDVLLNLRDDAEHPK